ncbi:MAG TPA: hypothetical protein VGI81_00935 [Tepidisphaeraceae bacterium]|jgi:hypothetical protein
MSTPRRRSHSQFAPALLESLEDRRLLSVAVPAAGGNSPALISPIPIPIASTGTILTGTVIHAETNQPFRAVIGTIHGLPALPTGYTLQGTINWGDGTPTSPAQFVPQPNGVIDVLGAHTYANVGTDDIGVVVTAAPPAGSLAPVKLIGVFHSKATVIAPNGGVTLNETVGVPFTANLGIFHSNLSSVTMTALISWGDGTRSVGKIVALPTAGPIGGFAVYGSHSYASTGSYAVHIVVISSTPSPTATTPIAIVAQLDSVIDVLPPFPTTV